MAEPLVTFEQAQAVTEFAQALYAYDQFGFWSPMLSNQLLQSLNNNPETPSSDKIRKALAEYKENAEQIQGYMEYMKFWDMIFARTIQAYCNALSFDLQPVCINAFTQSDYESSAYQEDKRRVYDFLNKFDYKAEFSKVVAQIVTHETYFTWFRKTKWGNKGMKFALQILPQDRCLLTGYWEKGLLFDFDMSYFLQAGVDINGFDPAFKKYYQRVFGSEEEAFKNYRPTNPLNRRNGAYAMWTQTSPSDGAWAFKWNPSTFNNTPFLAPFLKNAIANDDIAQLQYNKDIASAYAILAGEIRLFDSAKSGTKANQFAIDPKTLGGFMQKAKAGLGSLSKLAAMPLENVKFYQFEDKNANMYSTQLATSAGVGSGMSRVIYSSDRQSNAEIEAGLNDMYQTMKPLYPQFSNFLEFYVNQLTKKYKWKFIFDGSNYPFEREARFDKVKKMADSGIVLPMQTWASVSGYQPQVFEAMMAESKYTGWVDKYTQLLKNTNTTKGDSDNEGGRHRENSTTLTPSGEASRETLEG